MQVRFLYTVIQILKSNRFNQNATSVDINIFIYFLNSFYALLLHNYIFYFLYTLLEHCYIFLLYIITQLALYTLINLYADLTTGLDADTLHCCKNLVLWNDYSTKSSPILTSWKSFANLFSKSEWNRDFTYRKWAEEEQFKLIQLLTTLQNCSCWMSLIWKMSNIVNVASVAFIVP